MKKNLKKMVSTIKGERITNKKVKGALNFMEICVLIAICLIVAYPLYADTFSSMCNFIATWSSKALSAVFK